MSKRCSDINSYLLFPYRHLSSYFASQSQSTQSSLRITCLLRLIMSWMQIFGIAIFIKCEAKRNWVTTSDFLKEIILVLLFAFRTMWLWKWLYWGWRLQKISLIQWKLSDKKEEVYEIYQFLYPLVAVL